MLTHFPERMLWGSLSGVRVTRGEGGPPTTFRKTLAIYGEGRATGKIAIEKRLSLGKKRIVPAHNRYERLWNSRSKHNECKQAGAFVLVCDAFLSALKRTEHTLSVKLMPDGTLRTVGGIP